MSVSRSVAVVKYNAGNIRSVLCALTRLGVDAVVSDDPLVLRAASRVIFPGVGEAASAMRYMQESHLDETLLSLQQPFLGICLGMQLMCAFSEENSTGCLGMFDAQVVRFGDSPGLKVPHMGWNTIHNLKGPLFTGLGAEPWFYFVHSYHATLSSQTIATCTYGEVDFSAALCQRNFKGVQFHPEKSGPSGAKVLQNFLSDHSAGGGV
jgi:imidazole glycerol-phosphate synthase subunit HisH